MNNDVLANLLRPQSFAEIVGQEAIVSILSRQAATKKIKHVYLFCGARGCGKTTTARVFAKALNDGEGHCVEIDAASNNGVDCIRALSSDAQQMSIDCNYKVYIIDEAHMMTTAAWNAALKLFEEPPKHVVFILCTTNPDKIPGTILSRVQRFDFHRIETKVIADKLEYISNEVTHNKYTREALDRIAIAADGYMRDAITNFDKCLDYSTDLTIENVEKVLGLVREESLLKITNDLLEKDIVNCLNELDILKNNSNDMLQVYDSLMSFVIEYAIYNKTYDINNVNIPRRFESSLNKDKFNELTKFATRLFECRKNANSSNAEVFLRMIILEMSK